jgi:glutathione S-transferase
MTMNDFVRGNSYPESTTYTYHTLRYYIFEHYRGYTIPVDDPELHAYREWYDWVFSLDSVKRTLPDKDRYLVHIGKYADSSARSKVANAVRRGVAAHEIDDDKDTY